MPHLAPDRLLTWSSAAHGDKYPKSLGRFYVNSGGVVIREPLEDMQNLLGFAASGNVAAMQRVFADQSSMVRRTCNSALLTVMAATPLTPHRWCLAPRWMVGCAHPSCWWGCSLLAGVLHLPFGSKRDFNLLQRRHCCVASWMQQCGSCNSLEAPGWTPLQMWVRFQTVQDMSVPASACSGS